MTPEKAVARHRDRTRPLVVEGVRTAVLEEGEGPPVVCFHGVPASAYLYRRVVPALAARGLCGIAFDLPGLGLAERPGDFDYSWTGLGRWAAAAVDALDLDTFHLVVHDIGGPVGFEVAAVVGDRVRSLTILNTVTEPATFTQPPVMRPFGVPVIGRVWLAGIGETLFIRLMRLQGVADRSAVDDAELLGHLQLLTLDDGGTAFLQIMRSFEPTAAKSELYGRTIRAVPHRQVVWGDRDPALTWERYGTRAVEVANTDRVTRLPAKHFLQEDHAPRIAELAAALVAEAEAGMAC